MGQFNIQTGEMMVGDMPAKAVKLVKEWIDEHRAELALMWDSQQMHSLPPLD